MSLINIKQIRNKPQASAYATIIFNGVTNVWSNLETGALLLPVGTSSDRPVEIVNGLIRFNTDQNVYEIAQNSAWQTIITSVSSKGVSGFSLYQSTSGSELQFRSIIPGNGIDISYAGDYLVISASPTIASVSSVGGGISLIAGTSGFETFFRSLTAGGIIDISLSGNTINISARQSPVTVSSLGTGSSILSTVSGNELRFKSIVGSGSIKVSAGSNEITISSKNYGIDAIQISGYDNVLSEPLITTIATARSNKKLSVESTTIHFTKAGNAGNGQWLFAGQHTNSESRVVMPYDGTILRVTGYSSNVNNNTKHASIFVNDTEYTSSLSFISSSAISVVNTNENIDFAAGDGIRVRLNNGAGGNIQNTTVSIWIKWREQ